MVRTFVRKNGTADNTKRVPITVGLSMLANVAFAVTFYVR